MISATKAKEQETRITGEITTKDVSEEMLVRPVVTLDSNIKIIGGDGTSSNPYLLSK